MNRTIIALKSVIAVLGVVVLGALVANVGSASLASVQPVDGCAVCHPKLSEQVPEDHFTPKLNGVQFCLGCHSTDRAATAFAWTRHQNHYTVLGEAAMCILCHQIDADGYLRLIGVEGGKDIPATMEDLSRMQPYYQSWATSSFQDHNHGDESVTCFGCHDTEFPTEAVKKEKCMTCHGTYMQLAAQSPFHYDAIYPHFGDGKPLECSLCHKAHEKSVLACNDCHSFGEEVP